MYSTKRDIVEDAFAEIGLAPYIFDLTSGMLERGLRRLEQYVAQLDASDNIRFGYPLSSNPDLDDEINLPASVENMLVTNLAILIAPGHGKTVSTELTKAAGNAYKAVERKFSNVIPERDASRLPSGAGNKPRRNSGQFMPSPSESFATDSDGSPNLY